jgi:hypothetical protein
MQIKRFPIIIILLFVIFVENVYGQTKKPTLIGIQPSITVEPFYEKGELDINIFPLVLEIPIGQRINFRFLPLANYHLGGEKNGFSDIGFYTVLPIFFNRRETTEIKPYGFYIGPVIGLGRNFINDHYTATFALEPGYLFQAKKSFTISIGCQFGASYFVYDSEPDKWIFHWGPKVTFGFWINWNKNNR